MIRLLKAKEREFVKEQECTLDVKTIEAAVAGEKWALEKVLAYYADYIEQSPGRNGRWRRCWRIMRIILKNWRQ